MRAARAPPGRAGRPSAGSEAEGPREGAGGAPARGDPGAPIKCVLTIIAWASFLASEGVRWGARAAAGGGGGGARRARRTKAGGRRRQKMSAAGAPRPPARGRGGGSGARGRSPLGPRAAPGRGPARRGSPRPPSSACLTAIDAPPAPPLPRPCLQPPRGLAPASAPCSPRTAGWRAASHVCPSYPLADLTVGPEQ